MSARFFRILSLLLWMAVLAMPSSGWAGDSSTNSAQQHRKKAAQLYDIGRWDDAIAEYEKAYALRPEPSVLFDMAQTFRRKGDAQRALDVYENFVAKAPTSPLRAEAEERIKALKAERDKSQRPQGNDSSTPLDAAPVPSVIAPLPEPASGFPPARAPGAQPPTETAPQPTPPTWPPAPTGAPAASPASGPYPMAPMHLEPVPPPAAPTPVEPAPTSPAPGPTAPVMATPSKMPPQSIPPPLAGQPQTAPQPEAIISQRTPPASTSESTGSSGLALRITGGVLTLGGIACLGLAAYHAYLVKQYSDKVTHTDTVFKPNHERAGKDAQMRQWVYGGIGAGATVVGIVLYVVGAYQKSSSNTGVTVLPAITPQGTMLAATGAF